MMAEEENTNSGATIPRDLHERYFAGLLDQKYFGVVESHIENGKIVRLKSRRTLLKEDLKELIRTE